MPRYLTLISFDEKQRPRDFDEPEARKRMGALYKEVTKAGVMLENGGLAPSAESTRLAFSGGEITVTDGPFTEAKEVVGGYAITQCEDQAEAVEWTRRFLATQPRNANVVAEVREMTKG
ncbi:MAG TPA: YciI family protein [Stackebrandtia sp.]|jgi:hypothetical protein|uniref:YciI family protein n=1 Tax=Stackebrandtia sp. TaxID=2023065 RepID=UPI002D4646A8|nr:YciI family protein [Stackebrandtia sp.]HZE40046.1 YciI family protein [Stackebrandtia sp.]